MSETKRYLRDSDYKKAIYLSDLDKLTREDEETLLDAELDAKACIESMLTDEYEIEGEFDLGETISEFGFEKEYLKGSYVVVDGRLSKAKAYSNPSRPPESQDFWRQMDLLEIDESTVSETYNQGVSYYESDIVSYGDQYFECEISNGVGVEYGSDYIVQPIISHWIESVDGTGATTFNISKKYIVGDVVSHAGKFYGCFIASSETGLNLYPDSKLWDESVLEFWSAVTDYSTYDSNTTLVEESGSEYALIEPANALVGKTPAQSIADFDAAWEEVVVQTYDRTERYLRPEGFEGYVSYNEKYFFLSEQDEPFVNSYTAEEEKYLFSPTSDPRNRNVVKCMIHLVIYQLCSVVVPDNIPTVRIENYKSVMEKLNSFSNMKSNPAIARKVFTITTVNPINGNITETERKASRWAVNEAKATRDSWTW